MHLKSLKIFCDVVDRRSFSRAADENGRSVEETLQIFDRTEDKDRGQHPQEYAQTASRTA